MEANENIVNKIIEIELLAEVPSRLTWEDIDLGADATSTDLPDPFAYDMTFLRPPAQKVDLASVPAGRKAEIIGKALDGETLSEGEQAIFHRLLVAPLEEWNEALRGAGLEDGDLKALALAVFGG